MQIGTMSLSLHLIDELRQRLKQDASIAVRAGEDARHAAQHSTTAMEKKKEDSRVMIEQSNLAFAQSRRAERALTQLKALDTLLENGVPAYSSDDRVGLGAVVEAVSEDDDGFYGRTFVMLPVGAGEELTGPSGDGIITVLTPQSPVGRAMLGKEVGDYVEVAVRDDAREWEIVELC